jgi:hypothetical protein
MRRVRWFLFVGLILVALAGCGGGDENGGEEGELSEAAKAACTGSALSDAPKLPPGFPQVDNATYTQQHTQGPTEVIEGYYEGTIQEAHDAYMSAFEQAGFTVLFDEVEENDSEVSWKGKGRSGQVAIRNECDEEGRVYLKVTNRPA